MPLDTVIEVRSNGPMDTASLYTIVNLRTISTISVSIPTVARETAIRERPRTSNCAR
ncbi:hypothetical protein PAXRUDRAFT_829797 [Paxillus rubicundulus Ve08.2h10]|uniref:Uncharacterized protein n=1 Tax=Paxillus rubicundulus Ve08.2h10 TaxID=930991 RepID=A0A0D0E571_9AGAM|nr:hypothetical protein PAXRUDRAFT_829797 [Paxillus rubicundulus Ve08.2h10]